MAEKLTAFVKARLDEEAERAWAVHDVEKCDAMLYEEDTAAHARRRDPACDCGYPERRRREIAALRLVSVTHQPERFRACGECGDTVTVKWPCSTARAIAVIWEGYPDYAAALADPEAE